MIVIFNSYFYFISVSLWVLASLIKSLHCHSFMLVCETKDNINICVFKKILKVEKRFVKNYSIVITHENQPKVKCKYVTPNNFKNREVNDTRILKATVCCYALMISRHANDDDCYMRTETGSSSRFLLFIINSNLKKEYQKRQYVDT